MSDDFGWLEVLEGYHEINVNDIVAGQLLDEVIPWGGEAPYRWVTHSGKSSVFLFFLSFFKCFDWFLSSVPCLKEQLI